MLYGITIAVIAEHGFVGAAGLLAHAAMPATRRSVGSFIVGGTILFLKMKYAPSTSAVPI